MHVSRTRRLATVVVSGFALTVSLGACSDTETQPEAEAAVCDSVVEVRDALAQVAALDATSTVADARAAKDALASAVDGLRTSAAGLESADTAAISSATDQISGAIDDIASSDTLGEAAATVQGSTGALDSALTEISDGVQCE